MPDPSATTIVGETAVVIAGLPHRVTQVERDIDRLEAAFEGIRTLIEGMRDDFRDNYVTAKSYETAITKLNFRLDEYDRLYKDSLIDRAKTWESKMDSNTHQVMVVSAATGVLYLVATVVLHFVK